MAYRRSRLGRGGALQRLAKEVKATDSHEAFRRYPDESSLAVLFEIAQAAQKFSPILSPLPFHELGVSLVSRKEFRSARRHPNSRIGKLSHELGRRTILEQCELANQTVTATLGSLIVSKTTDLEGGQYFIVKLTNAEQLITEGHELVQAIDQYEGITHDWPPIRPHITLAKVPGGTRQRHLWIARELTNYYGGIPLTLLPIPSEAPHPE